MDLFGDIGDISSETDEDTPPHLRRHPVANPVPPQGPVAKQPAAETRTEVVIPTIRSDLGNELYFVKLPRFLSIEPKPFDPQFYEDEFQDEKVLYEEDRTRLKIKVENTIRWRIRRDEDGKDIKESNTRIVKWSDGSMSLHLGNEVFDVHRARLPGHQNHLFVREENGLLGQAVFTSRLTFRPHAMDSATHKKVTLLPRDGYSQAQKIKILPTVGCNFKYQPAAVAEGTRIQGRGKRRGAARAGREQEAEGYLHPAQAGSSR